MLKVAHDIAGFRHGQGEMLRRALGSKYSFQLLDQLEVVFMEGALKNGVEEEVARTIFERLIQAGALDRWGNSRHQLLWDAGVLYKACGRLPLRLEAPAAQLPEPTAMERLNMEFAATGLSTQHHPMQYFRKWCAERRILRSKQMMRARERAVVETAGMVVIIQAPETAKEIRFITLEDEFELINVVVFPDLYQRTRKIIRGERFL